MTPLVAAEHPSYRPARGAHVYVERGLYSHHGIDCGDGTVIDFAGQEGGKAKDSAVIRLATLEEFGKGDPIRVRAYGASYQPEIVLARARSMVGCPGYDLFSNNCEHFATWCVTGEHSSRQVEAAWRVSGMGVAGRIAPQAAAGAVVGLGDTAPRSASNVMSGLKKLGGSSAGGVAVVAGIGALIGAGTIMFVLRDRSYFTETERAARGAGRMAGVGGAVVGVGVSVHAVHVLGVAGTGAAGISSGLAAFGGGGMVAGVAATALLPLLSAFGFGLLAYWLVPHIAGHSGGARSAT
jgi:hypothetical protein